MNTLIEYRYRDASNYKVFRSEILLGEVSRDQITECLERDVGDNGGFIPAQVGLEDIQHEMANWPSADDHVWHELVDVLPTTRKSTLELTALQLLKNFRKAKGNWNVLEASNRLGLV